MADGSARFELGTTHALILGAGCAVGLLGAWLAAGLALEFPQDLQRARELGITSIAILGGYSKSRDLVGYACVIGLPLLCALVPWGLWARPRLDSLRRALLPRPRGRLPGGGLSLGTLAAVALFGLLLTFDADRFLRPAFNSYVGAWPFLGEEGEMLDWAQRVLAGAVYGRDYFCLYGPLLVHGLAWNLALFGENVFVARVVTHALDLCGFALVLGFLYRMLGSRGVFVAASIVYLSAFHTLPFHSPNTTILRFVLGMLPLFLLADDERRSGRRCVLAGFAAGVSLLFSQEAGLCGSIASAAILLLGARARARDAGLFAGGVVAALAPFLVWALARGALGAAVQGLWAYPRLAGLGFGAYPFPSLRDFAASPFGSGALLHYWVIAIYLFSLLRALPALALRRRDRRLQMELGLLVYGLLLYRVVLGRADELNALKAAHPAFLLCFLHLDTAVAAVLARRPWSGGAIAAALALSVTLVFAGAPELSSKAGMAWDGLRDPLGKLSPGQEGIALPEFPRLGVRVDEKTARTLRAIRAYLSSDTAPDDPVYFFPNEAIYAFLFERPNPTRYAIATFAITTEQREELVEDLEASRPLIVFSPETWRVDGIPEHVQLPEITRYLERSYGVTARSPDVMFLRRTE